VEEVANVARESEWVDPASGVSARLTIALLEAVVSNAERRAILTKSDGVVLRIGDFYRAIPAISGKIELVFEGEREGPETVATHLIGKAVERVFDRRFPDFFSGQDDEESPYEPLASWAKGGGHVVIEDTSADGATLEALSEIPGVTSLLERYLGELEPEAAVFGAEFVLEGLHQHSVLAKDTATGGARFSDMVSSMWEDFEDPTSPRS
jgi:magnesium chelatase subunit I